MNLESNINFVNDKRKHLDKMIKGDRSRKGSLDRNIEGLVNAINNNNNMFTTSSCSGRIRLIGQMKEIKKNKTEWLFTSHDPLNDELRKDIHNKLDVIKTTNKVLEEYWFIQESAILHCCVKDISVAHKLLVMARESGFKRSGLQSVKNRLILELVNINRIETIVAEKNNIIITHEYLDKLIDVANRKLKKNFEKIEKLRKKILEFNKFDKI